MAKSKIVLTFNTHPLIVGETILISNNLSGVDIFETFELSRTASFQSTIGISSVNSAVFYTAAVTADYTTTGLYVVTRIGNVVTIEATQPNVVFVEEFNTTLGKVTTFIDNQVEAPPFTIDDVTFLAPTVNPVCSHVKVQVDTSELAVKVTSPLVIDPNLVNPFFFEWVRGDNISIICESATAEQDTEAVTTPQTLSASNITVNILGAPIGATVTINVSSVDGLALEYSLDNITFKVSNTFTGILPGNYTAYVRDQFGCNVNDAFVVDDFTPSVDATVPFFSLSKSMSIRFKRDIVWGDCSNYKNEENTLSCENNVLLPYQTIQQFQTCDTDRPIQFKTNRDTREVNVIKEDGTKDTLAITKHSSNLGRKSKLDSTYYDINGTQTGVYFTSGNTYDYDTDIQNGTYALNGALPDFGIIGNSIFLDGTGWFDIVDIIFNASVNADVLVINLVYGGIPATIIASSIYNIENFEVYEFEVDFSIYEDQIIQVEVLATDAVFDDVRELSEKIEVAERFEDTMEIRYWNPTNTDVFYSTGIQNLIRVNFETFIPGIDPKIDALNTDTNTILLNSQMYETKILTFSPVTFGIMRQITQAILHKELYLDGVKYVISGDPETEPWGNSNLITVTATFTKDGNVYNSEVDGQGTEIESIAPIIGLLTDDNTYIKL
jgi:hypothetical protein